MKPLLILLLFLSVAEGQEKETDRLVFDTSAIRYVTDGSFFIKDSLLSVDIDTVKVKVSYPMKWKHLEYVGVKELWCIQRRESWKFRIRLWEYTYYDDKWKRFELPKIYFRWN